jgi:hypothetical protein
MVIGSPAVAAGIDSRAYTCPALQALIAAQRFVFIGNPDFQDFAVADASQCPAGNPTQLRSVPTSDSSECPVIYCVPARGGGSS